MARPLPPLSGPPLKKTCFAASRITSIKLRFLQHKYCYNCFPVSILFNVESMTLEYVACQLNEKKILTRSMVLILEMVRNRCATMEQYLLFDLFKAVTNRMYFSEKRPFSSMPAQHGLRYHLIKVPWIGEVKNDPSFTCSNCKIMSKLMTSLSWKRFFI